MSTSFAWIQFWFYFLPSKHKLTLFAYWAYSTFSLCHVFSEAQCLGQQFHANILISMPCQQNGNLFFSIISAESTQKCIADPFTVSRKMEYDDHSVWAAWPFLEWGEESAGGGRVRKNEA